MIRRMLQLFPMLLSVTHWTWPTLRSSGTSLTLGWVRLQRVCLPVPLYSRRLISQCMYLRVCFGVYVLAAEIAALCPKLSALFLPVDSGVTQAGLAALRQICPEVRLRVIGQQLSRRQLLGLLRSYTATRRLNLLPVHTQLTDAGLAELATLCPAVETVFTGSQITRQGLEAVAACCPVVLCVQLGHEIDESAFEALQTQYRDRRVLDLTDLKLFGRITQAGLRELPRLFPDVEMIFTPRIGSFHSIHQVCALIQRCARGRLARVARRLKLVHLDTLLRELRRVAERTPRVDIRAVFDGYGNGAGPQWDGWLTESHFVRALKAVGTTGINADVLRSVGERFGKVDPKRGVLMVASTALLRVVGLDTEVNRAIRGLGEPTEEAVRFILMSFYKANYPEFATDDKLT
eukprot:COSAG01_NODE_9367_length_2467_cov_4.648649_1_plen_404_part_10